MLEEEIQINVMHLELPNIVDLKKGTKVKGQHYLITRLFKSYSIKTEI